jgi:hypothetical protein
MKDARDNRTLDIEGGARRQRGRPPSEETRTAAERKADSRAAKKAAGLETVTIELSLDVLEAIRAKTVFGVTTQAQVIDKILRNQLLRKR